MYTRKCRNSTVYAGITTLGLTLLRHAAVAKQLQGTCLGWNDVSIEVALFEAFKVAKLKEKAFDIVISSDLLRCQQTLKKIGKSFTLNPSLREVKFNSEIEGKRFTEIEKLESYDKRYLESESSWHNYICKESQIDFTTRLKTFLNTLPKDKEILLCSHAGSIKVMMGILGQKEEQLNYLEYRRYEL